MIVDCPSCKQKHPLPLRLGVLQTVDCKCGTWFVVHASRVKTETMEVLPPKVVKVKQKRKGGKR